MKTLRLKFNFKRNYIVTESSLLLMLFLIMPIVDSLSGLFHEQYPVGQIYRFILFAVMFFLLLKISQRDFLNMFLAFCAFFICQILISDGYVQKSIQDVVKLFTPIVCITLFSEMLANKRINLKEITNVFNKWSIMYPVLILVPGVFGIGINAYEGTMGWKGLFYATNEISFILSCLIMYQFWNLKNRITLKNLILLLLNCLSIFLMGTKTGYATIILFAVLFLFSAFRAKLGNQKIKLLLLVLICVSVFPLVFDKLQDMIKDITERWNYQRNVYSYSVIDFLFSHRLRRFDKAFEIFLNDKMWYPIIGWGFGAELVGFPNMEMDFFDVLFRTGILGLIYIVWFYVKCVLRFGSRNIFGKIMLLWSLALSFGAGHVIFYGQSGMMLALFFVFVSQIKKVETEQFNYIRRGLKTV